MTGRINYTPEAQQQLNELDDWITKAASAEIARRFVSAILEHIDGILAFPDCRPSARRRPTGHLTSTLKKTLVAYEVDESSGELVVNISVSSTVALVLRTRRVPGRRSSGAA